jgi:hypothetical protein
MAARKPNGPPPINTKAFWKWLDAALASDEWPEGLEPAIHTETVFVRLEDLLRPVGVPEGDPPPKPARGRAGAENDSGPGNAGEPAPVQSTQQLPEITSPAPPKREYDLDDYINGTDEPLTPEEEAEVHVMDDPVKPFTLGDLFPGGLDKVKFLK